ncbi:hypothetical protein [Nitrincola alkalilacustris]|uniref:hypothetical protein n=1 Tax=Nitrincola alkalilacustris TaxID=1571224 RepID=UPI00124CD892|nr:hypothetical protein [Nitrincola alkalilacustris]
MQKRTLLSRLIPLTLLGVLFFTPPILLIFDTPASNGLSWLPLYLFAAWLILILLTALVVERSHEE